VSDPIRIQFTRFSAFYSPLIATIAGGFLKEEGFEPQKLGCWAPHVEITRPAFEVTLDVFQHAGLITKRHRYEDVVAPPPEAT
jgi:hypothetical protein